MRCGRVLMLAALVAGISGPADAQSDTRPVAVIELFTSQGKDGQSMKMLKLFLFPTKEY